MEIEIQPSFFLLASYKFNFARVILKLLLIQLFPNTHRKISHPTKISTFTVTQENIASDLAKQGRVLVQERVRAREVLLVLREPSVGREVRERGFRVQEAPGVEQPVQVARVFERGGTEDDCAGGRLQREEGVRVRDGDRVTSYLKP